MSVVYWPMWTPAKWIYTAPFMCTHLEWGQLMRSMFKWASLFSTGQWAQSSENMTMTHIQKSIYILLKAYSKGMELHNCDSQCVMSSHMHTFRFKTSGKYFLTFTFLSCYQFVETEWMNDPERPEKSNSGTVSGQTISPLTLRPQLHLTAVSVPGNLAWQLPVPDSQMGCQHKLWSLIESGGRGQWQIYWKNLNQTEWKKGDLQSACYLKMQHLRIIEGRQEIVSGVCCWCLIFTVLLKITFSHFCWW